MPGVRLSGGIVLDRAERAWQAADPGTEVLDDRQLAGEPVVVGPAAVTRRQVDRARRELRRLIAHAGPVVAGAGVDLGSGLRSGRLEGGRGNESRRHAVLAAVEVLGFDGLDRLGSRAGTVVALFGVAATKRLGAAALDALADGALPAIRLAVAASDLLGPEQLERLLRLRPPYGVDPVPPGTSGLLTDHLTTVLTPFPPPRRAVLVESAWDDVLGWQRSAAARAQARRRRVSRARVDARRREVHAADADWWRRQAGPEIGGDPSPAAMLTWVPRSATWADAVARSFREAIAATALLRAALAAEEQPLEAAVLAHLDSLTYAATAPVPGKLMHPSDLVPVDGPAAARASAVSAAVVHASDPNAAGHHDLAGFLAANLGDACELAHAVLGSALELVRALLHARVEVAPDTPMTGWREVAGYTATRDPRHWMGPWLVTAHRPPLSARLGPTPAGDEAAVEVVEDLMWIADLADALARWYGHDRAEIDLFAPGAVDVDPYVPPPDPQVPLLASLPLAMAGAAQLVGLGAEPPRRPKSWGALVDGLLAAAEGLALSEELVVAEEILAWDGRELAGTGLRFEVARRPRQLREWGNYMGNCIAGYGEYAGERYALLALRDHEGELVVNVSVERAGGSWRIEQARARFNDDPAEPVAEALRRWVGGLRRPSEPLVDTVPDEPVPPAARRRRPAAAEQLRRAAARLGDAVGDPGEWAEGPLGSVARELGWEGDGGAVGAHVTIARSRPDELAAATATALDGRCALADLWQATAFRPLGAALERLDDEGPALARLTDPVAPRSLRRLLQDPRVSGARATDLAARRVRAALGDLVREAEPRLGGAVAASPHVGFVASAVLSVTAWGDSRPGLEWLNVGLDGTVPGRPSSSVTDHAGPWAAARAGAIDLGVPAEDVDRVLADAPGRFLLVPSAWLAGRPWSALWARAQRTTRAQRRSATR